MSDLTDALARIETWLAHHAPANLDELAPGLELEEISERTANLPFTFPDDLKELFQWRNGYQGYGDYGGSIIPVYFFMGLEGVIECYSQELNLNTPGWDERWLPLFPYEENYMIGVVGQTPQTPTQLIDYARDDPSCELMHTSIAHLMQTLANCFEAGIFQFEEYQENLYNEQLQSYEEVTAYQLVFEGHEAEAYDIYQMSDPGVNSWWYLI